MRYFIQTGSSRHYFDAPTDEEAAKVASTTPNAGTRSRDRVGAFSGDVPAVWRGSGEPLSGEARSRAAHAPAPFASRAPRKLADHERFGGRFEW